ncbi:MAG: CHAT domain-containing protein [Spirochaetes bacterium]|nr:CHAT domain-containing protein [Spirochaetota bacterium]
MEQQHLPVIFLAFANDRDDTAQYLRNLPLEHQGVRQALQKAEQSGLCQVVERANVTVEDIINVFQEYQDRLAIFHFGGHANGYQLLLESATGVPDMAHSDGLVPFLTRQKGLKFIFLNGCSSQRQAKGLMNAGIPIVVGTSQAINDEIATQLSIRFYSGLANGLSLFQAWQDAEDTIIIKKGNTNYRDLYTLQKKEVEERFPWEMFVKPGAENIKDWNLPEAVNNPLFGFPPVPSRYPLPDDPYLFLRWYNRKHADVFWGRARYIRTLYEKITFDKMPPLVLLYSQSGCGKSSLLEAGILPRLEESHEAIYFRYGHQYEFSKILTELIEQTCKEKEISISETGDLKSTWLELEKQIGKPLIIIIDQAEEIFTIKKETVYKELRNFFDDVDQIFNNPTSSPAGKLILSYRKEFHPEFLKQCINYAIPCSPVFLDKMDKQDIVEVVLGITSTNELRARYHLTVQDELAEIIANDLLEDQSSPLAPTLQIILTKMWNEVKKSSAPCFTVELYQHLRKDGIAMADFFYQQIKRTKDWNKEYVNSGLILDILFRHTTPMGTAGEISSTQLNKLYQSHQDILPSVLDKLNDLYLLYKTEGKKSQTRLAHDTLAPVIQNAYHKSDKVGQRARRILDSKMVDYIEKKESWLDKAALRVVERGLAGTKDLTKEEKKLLKISIKKRNTNELLKKILIWSGIIAFVLIVIMAISSAVLWIDSRENLSIMFKTRAESALAEKQWDTAMIYYYKLIRMGSFFSPNWYNDLSIKMNILETTHFISPELFTLTEKEGINEVALSQDGSFFLSACSDGLIKKWDTNTGQLLKVFAGHNQAQVLSLVLFPQEDKMVSGGSDGTIIVWDMESGKTEKIMREHKKEVTTIAVSPDGRYLLSGSYYEDHAFLWDLKKEEVHPLTGHQEGVPAVAFSPDGEWIATGGKKDKAIIIRRLGHPFSIYVHKVLKRHHEAILSLLFLNNKYLISGSGDSSLMIWDINNGEFIDTFIGHNGSVTSIIPSGPTKDDNPVYELPFQYLFTGSRDKTILMWNIESGTKIKTLSGHTDYVTSIAYHPRRKILLSGSLDGTIKLWSLPRDRKMPKFENPGYSQNSVLFSPDTKYLAIGHTGGEVEIQNTSLKGRKVKWRENEDDITAIAFSHDSELIATGSKYGEVILRERQSGRRLIVLQKLLDQKNKVNRVMQLQFSACRKYLASAFRNGNVIVWDVVTGKKKYTFSETYGEVKSVAFSSPSKDFLSQNNFCPQYIAAGYENGTIGLWNFETRERIDLPQVHKKVVRSLAFSPDNTILASGGGDRNINLLDINRKSTIDDTMCHEDVVTSVAFDSSGKYLVSGGWDNQVRVWGLEAKQEIKHYKEYQGDIWYTAFSPDDNFIFSVSYDGTTAAWETGFNLENDEIEEVLTSLVFYGMSYHIDEYGDIVFFNDPDYSLSLLGLFDSYEDQLLLKYTDAEEGKIWFMPNGGKDYASLFEQQFQDYRIKQ